MTRCPLSIRVIGWLFVAAGVVGLAYHATEFRALHPFQLETAWICFVRLLAVLGGVCTLRGKNWARWLLLVWMVFHVVLSAFHSLSELAMHGSLLAVITWFLFRPKASAHFRRVREEPATVQKHDDTRMA